MADLIKRLAELNKKRADLDLYASRMKLARWLAPETVKSFVRKAHERFEEVSRERRRVLELIMADPVLRHRLKAKEEQALSEVGQGRGWSHGRPFTPSTALLQTASRAIGLEAQEKRAEADLKEAQDYYKDGMWKRDGVPVNEVTKLLDDLTVARDAARFARGQVHDGLQMRLETELLEGHGPASLQREKILNGLRRDQAASTPHEERPSPLSVFLGEHGQKQARSGGRDR